VLQAALDRARDVAEVLGLEPHLGGDMGPRRQRSEMAADRLLGGAVAVDRRGVDPVDAGRDRARERGMSGRLVGVDEDTAGDAAAERELGNLQPGASEQVLAHETGRGQ
jgi:hypothetical protein